MHGAVVAVVAVVARVQALPAVARVDGPRVWRAARSLRRRLLLPANVAHLPVLRILLVVHPRCDGSKLALPLRRLG